MASHDQALPAVNAASSLDEAWAWFWRFLKTELSPYPGRAWTVGRMVISASIVVLVVMTFRIPYGFLGAIYTMLLSRENPSVTLLSGIRTIISYAVATIYTVVGVMLLIDDPLTHFIWITLSLFLAFYLIRVVPDYITAIGFGFTLAGAIPLWDETFLTVNQRTENTLWLGFSVVLGTVVTVAVEYVFRRVHPATDLSTGLQSRLRAVETLLRQIAKGEGQFKSQKEIELYSTVGTSRLRRIVARAGLPADLTAQMSIAVALLGRLINLAESLQIIRSSNFAVPEAHDRERCERLADQIAALERDIRQNQLPEMLPVPAHAEPSAIPLLPELERVVALISHAFSRSGKDAEFPVTISIEQEHQRIFAADAFTNPDHLRFAIRGTLATMLAYTVYTGIAWPQLSTAVATCIITALSTIGSSRQKQFLRLGGAVIGGFVFGMGAQVFVLPYLDSITGFLILFGVVTAISAWIATATPRLSYLGVQLALAFYLINVQEFAPQYSLAIARDRVVGVLLGLLCMWLVFDRLWVRDALTEMQDTFARNLRLLGELIRLGQMEDQGTATKRLIDLRDQMNDGFSVVRSQADAVLFEFGPSRQRKLAIRDDFRRWQPTIGTLLQVEITYLQYCFRPEQSEIPPVVSKAQLQFEDKMAEVVEAMADEVNGKLPRVAPDMQAAARELEEQVRQAFPEGTLPPAVGDVVTLTKNLASIVSPLCLDVHKTFTNAELATLHHPQARPQQA